MIFIPLDITVRFVRVVNAFMNAFPCFLSGRIICVTRCDAGYVAMAALKYYTVWIVDPRHAHNMCWIVV
jgi:hypothetical protein